MSDYPPGTTFYLNWPPKKPGHLYFLLSLPVNDWVPVANFTDGRRPVAEILIKPGEHPSISKDTTINFAWARLIRYKKLTVHLDKNPHVLGPSLSVELLQRIQRTGKNSRYIDERCKRFLNVDELLG